MNNKSTSDLIDSLVNFILYGDIHEVPLKVLGDHYDRAVEKAGTEGFDIEQLTRLSIAATVKNLEKDVLTERYPTKICKHLHPPRERVPRYHCMNRAKGCHGDCPVYLGQQKSCKFME